MTRPGGLRLDRPRHFRRGAGCSLALACLLAVGCAGPTSVTRTVTGRAIEGPFVPEDGYRWYLTGIELEAAAKPEEASRAYARAIDADRRSPEPWVRYGATRCRCEAESARGANRQDADAAFEQAEHLAEDLEELWTERARCWLRRGDPARALDMARRAVEIDPDGLDPLDVLVDAFERSGRFDDAGRYLDGMAARSPGRGVYEQIEAFARRTKDAPRAQRAAELLGEREPSLGDLDRRLRTAILEPPSASAQALRAVERLSVRLRIPSGLVALRAAALGAAGIARSLGELRLAAEPRDSDARIAVAIAADLLGDEKGFGDAVSAWPRDASLTSPLGRALFGELVERRVGQAARGHWRETAQGAGSDSLLQQVLERGKK